LFAHLSSQIHLLVQKLELTETSMTVLRRKLFVSQHDKKVLLQHVQDDRLVGCLDPSSFGIPAVAHDHDNVTIVAATKK